jgi:dienelactone hydrolase
MACTIAGLVVGGSVKAQTAGLFDYDKKAAFRISETSAEKHGTVTVRDVILSPAAGDRELKAYIVEPEGKGAFAGVLWVHWLGDPATTNRSEFLDEALALAPQGVVSLLVDAMWSAPEWYGHRVPEQDYENSLRQVISLRRALDVLATHPSVDPARLGFVGHDYGGMYGMLMAGADLRPRTYVYVAVAASLSEWAFFANQPASKAAYLRQNAALELTDALRRVTNASTLFQFGATDAYVSRASTTILFSAAHDPKENKVYQDDHAMRLPAVAQERDAWLEKELGLKQGTERPGEGAVTRASPRSGPTPCAGG